MKKSKLKKFLNLYNLIIQPVNEKRSVVEIQLYGRKKTINIPSWLWNIEEIFQKIILAEDNEIIGEIIDKVYRQGEDDKKVYLHLPITESGYYRLKRKIEEKIYDLYILNGDVSEDEILENKIF